MANAAPGTLDPIIVDSTDPAGPAVGLFTQGRFESCLRALAPGGMVIQQSEWPLLHMDILRQMYADLRGAGFADVKTLFFPQALYPSGWRSATMARKKPGHRRVPRGGRQAARLRDPLRRRR